MLEGANELRMMLCKEKRSQGRIGSSVVAACGALPGHGAGWKAGIGGGVQGRTGGHGKAAEAATLAWEVPIGTARFPPSPPQTRARFLSGHLDYCGCIVCIDPTPAHVLCP